jgi:hypothetical protein
MILLMLMAALAANFAGTWTGTMKTTITTDSAFMVLAQDGNTITGTIGPDREAQFKITKANATGEVLTIEAQPGGTLRFSMKLEGDKLAGGVFEDESLIGSIEFERVRK